MDCFHLEETFDRLSTKLLADLKPDEHLKLELWAEQSQFVRFNRAKIRQAGSIIDGELTMTLMQAGRNAYYEIPFTGDDAIDAPLIDQAIDQLRQDVAQLPEDPYLVIPTGSATSRSIQQGQLLSADAVADALLPEVQDLDFTGIYAGGAVVRAYADSAGQKHWFVTDSFALDYSLFAPNGQAVKGTVAGSDWDAAAYAAKIADSRYQLDRLSQPPKPIPRGQYRTYLAPAAAAELLSMFSWGGVSEADLQQGSSALAMLQRGERLLSPQFSLKENFSRGLVPRFNGWGEVAPIELTLIDRGQLVNTLISSRTAKEYGKVANGAGAGESLRSPEICPGQLSSAEILAKLDTGLYLSNLHYLNWSDRPTGRVTGMTRYACFWVENGQLIAPIENLRFDESLYACFGDELLHLTEFQEFVPEVGTYGRRAIGGAWVPGVLCDRFTFTL